MDPQPSRAGLAGALGVEHVAPEDAAGECDVVVHASSTAAGLARGLELLGDEEELIEMSWYGDEDPTVPLGADFHARRARRSTAGRIATALDALRDPRSDALLSGSWPFEELPATMARLAGGAPEVLCHVVRYD